MPIETGVTGPGWQLLAATALAGVPLVNGTQTILSWNVPSDGQLHRVCCMASLLVTSGQTGGLVNLSVTLPSPGSIANDALFNGGQAANSYMSFNPGTLVQPGSVVTVNQASALTVGAAVLWAELWGF